MPLGNFEVHWVLDPDLTNMLCEWKLPEVNSKDTKSNRFAGLVDGLISLDNGDKLLVGFLNDCRHCFLKRIAAEFP